MFLKDWQKISILYLHIKLILPRSNSTDRVASSGVFGPISCHIRLERSDVFGKIRTISVDYPGIGKPHANVRILNDFKQVSVKRFPDRFSVCVAGFVHIRLWIVKEPEITKLVSGTFSDYNSSNLYHSRKLVVLYDFWSVHVIHIWWLSMARTFDRSLRLYRRFSPWIIYFENAILEKRRL
jgi:hypothetical protein